VKSEMRLRKLRRPHQAYLSPLTIKPNLPPLEFSLKSFIASFSISFSSFNIFLVCCFVSPSSLEAFVEC